MRAPFWIIPVVATLAVGCVGKGRYTALQSELDQVGTELRSQLTAKALEAEGLKGELTAATAAVRELEVEVADLEERNATLIKDKSKLDGSIQEMAQALRDLEARKEASDLRVGEYQALLERLQDLIDAGRLKIKIVDGRMVVELPSDVLFPSGVAELAPEGQSTLAEIGGILAEIEDRHFQVEGHTDNVPINNRTFASNWELGAARAVNVVRALHQGGVALERLSAASYAEHRPVTPNATPEGRAANRRIEIVVVPDLSLLPGSQELERLADAD